MKDGVLLLLPKVEEAAHDTSEVNQHALAFVRAYSMDAWHLLLGHKIRARRRVVSRISKFACAILTIFYFGNPTGPHVAHAQESPKTLKDQLVGSWRLVSINNLRADGTKYELFGPDAKGIVIFDRNGTYSFQIMRAVRPAFVAESRMEGTAEENKAAVQGMISHFGIYEVDEPSRSITFRIEGSSYPNWDKTEQKRTFTLLGNQLTWSDPSAGPRPGDLQSDLIWKRAP